MVTWNTWWFYKVSTDAKDKIIRDLMIWEINKHKYNVLVDYDKVV